MVLPHPLFPTAHPYLRHHPSKAHPQALHIAISPTLLIKKRHEKRAHNAYKYAQNAYYNGKKRNLTGHFLRGISLPIVTQTILKRNFNIK